MQYAYNKPRENANKLSFGVYGFLCYLYMSFRVFLFLIVHQLHLQVY